jgi:hypothetical protein
MMDRSGGMIMSQRWAIGLAIAVVVAASSPAVAAGTPISFDTVDAVELIDGGGSIGQVLKLTGIVTGTATPTTIQFSFSNKVEAATRCERMATIAMSKPGKFRVLIAGITSSSLEVSCKLVAVAL